MRGLSLFAGIGGFDLAARWMGWQTVGFCEKDKFCQKILAKHWPDVPICSDIKDLIGDEYGPIEVIWGGFPCQPFSCAGKQKGQSDDRHLWPEMARVIAKTRPAWVVGENVTGIIGLALDTVLSDLENLAYTCQTLVIPAHALNAPHRRDRVWIIAHSAHADTQRESQLQGVQPNERRRPGRRRDEASANPDNIGRYSAGTKQQLPELGGNRQALADTQSERQNNGLPSRAQTSESGVDNSDFAVINTSSIRQQKHDVTTEPGSEWLAAWRSDPDGLFWQRPPEHEFCGMDDGLSPRLDKALLNWPVDPTIPKEITIEQYKERLMDLGIDWNTPEAHAAFKALKVVSYSKRIQSLGNAVVPQVVYQIFKAIESAEREANGA